MAKPTTPGKGELPIDKLPIDRMPDQAIGHLPAQLVLLTFEDVSVDPLTGISPFPTDYHGLTFSGIGNVIHPDYYPTEAYPWLELDGSGYQNGMLGSQLGYFWTDEAGEPEGTVPTPSISSTDGAEFDFQSGYFISAWNDGQSLVVEGWRDGQQVAEWSGTLNTTEATFIQFGSDFDSVDQVLFYSTGGVDNNPSDIFGGYFIAMDNLLVAF